jgi:hypothetical protein
MRTSKNKTVKMNLNKKNENSENKSASFLCKDNATMPFFSLEKCWYALDVDGNLRDTRKKLAAFLDPFVQRWEWKALVGSIHDESLTM